MIVNEWPLPFGEHLLLCRTWNAQVRSCRLSFQRSQVFKHTLNRDEILLALVFTTVSICP